MKITFLSNLTLQEKSLCLKKSLSLLEKVDNFIFDVGSFIVDVQNIILPSFNSSYLSASSNTATDLLELQTRLVDLQTRGNVLKSEAAQTLFGLKRVENPIQDTSTIQALDNILETLQERSSFINSLDKKIPVIPDKFKDKETLSNIVSDIRKVRPICKDIYLNIDREFLRLGNRLNHSFPEVSKTILP